MSNRTPIIRALNALWVFLRGDPSEGAWLSRSRRSLRLLISSVLIGGLLAPMLAFLPTPAGADGGDFTLDFVAAGAFTYNHATGAGGEYDGRLISKTNGVTESLQGGDFNCGDAVVFYTAIKVANDAVGSQNIELDYEFGSEPTGNGTVGIDDLETAGLNVGDTGNTGLDGDEVVTIQSENLVTAGKDHLDATVRVTNLNAGEIFILRLVTRLTCPTNDNPTGNIQSFIDDARVIAPVADGINTGNQTVPMMSLSDILLGGITIIKDTVPNSGQDFAFNATGTGVVPFALDDDGTDNNPLFSSRTFPGLAPSNVARVITETPMAGWTLTDIACSGATLSTVLIGADGDFDAGDTSVSITLVGGENVTCIFTNTELGSITIVKDTVPDNAENFTFTSPGLTPAGFDLDDDADPGFSNTQAFPGLLPGPRTITETPEAGFVLNLIECTGATDSTVTIGAAGGFDPGDTSVTIDLAPGEDVSCEFTNTELNSITIIKNTVPDSGEDFAFTSPGLTPADFILDDDADGILSNVQQFPGLMLVAPVTITEPAVAGWTLTEIDCDGAEVSDITIGAAGGFDTGDNAVTIDLAPGENVTCTFTNTQEGSIAIQKDTDPDSAQAFEFATTGADLSNFSLDDDGTDANPLSAVESFTGLLPAAAPRTITETPVAGWTLTNIVCQGATLSTVLIGNDSDFDDGDTSVSIDLAPGEDVRCTFTNTELGSITIVKAATPEDGTDFAFTSPGLTPASFSLDVDGADANPLSDEQRFDDLLPVERTITETPLPAGWVLASIECLGATASTITIGDAGGFDTGDTAVTIDLAPGEDVVCTFTNRQLPSSITIVKNAVPNSAQDFAFTGTGPGVQNFDLDDDADPTLLQSVIFANLAPGERVVTETPVVGWTLSNIVCTGATASTVTIGAAGGFNAGDTAVTIDLAAGDAVTCTFTNTAVVVPDPCPEEVEGQRVALNRGGNECPDDDDEAEEEEVVDDGPLGGAGPIDVTGTDQNNNDQPVISPQTEISAPAPAVAPAGEDAPSPQPQLPRTGAGNDLMKQVQLALVLVIIGVPAMIFGRRRRNAKA